MKILKTVIFSLLLIILSPLAFSSEDSFSSRLGKDHGLLEPGHEQATAIFVDKNLKDNGNYDIAKIDSFLDRLDREKVSLSEDLYETQLIENLELNLIEYEDAKNEALKEIDEEKNELLFSYNEYLIPKIKKLRELLLNGASVEAMDGITDDFIRLYISFYTPNKRRTALPADAELGDFIRHFFKPFKFKINDPSKLEADNLIVENSNITEINNCLPKKVSSGHYLSGQELDSLKNCGMDISRLNPGVSALWQPITQKRLNEIKKGRPELFPGAEDKLFFKVIKLSGMGSPKMDVEFLRNGKKIKLKLKMGKEVHSDNLTSMMGNFLGFTQDAMSYRDKVRVYLGSITYDNFVIQFSRKYGQKAVVKHIDAHGGEKGAEWIDISDVLLEASPKEEIRLTGLGIESWDLTNRREYRSLILWFGFFNIIDTKYSNFKLILKKAEDGTLYPIHRLHDTGDSLSKAYSFHGGIKNLIGGTFESGSINSFLPSFLKSDGKTVELFWNDATNTKSRFSATTYNDLKWMARIVAQIKDEDIRQMIADAGAPEDLKVLYHNKIVSRRNEIVRAFGLENEYPIYEVSDLDAPNSGIKNGKIVSPYREGHRESWAGENDILGTLVEMIDFKNPFSDLSNKFSKMADLHVNGGVAGLGAGIETNTITELVPGDETNPISVLSTSPGISIKISRKVGNNPEPFVTGENGGGRFYIKDYLKFEIDLRVPYFKQVSTILPLNVGGELKIYSKEVEFVHYAGSIREAYKKPFKLFHMLRGLKTFAAEELNPMEIIKNEDSYGFALDVNVTAYSYAPILTNEAGIKIGWVRTTPAYLLRDQFGALHVYKEKSTDINFGLHTKLGGVNLLLLDLPLLGLDFTYDRFFYEAADYSFDLPSYNEQKTVQDKLKAQRELEALNVLMHRDGDQAISSIIRRNFHILADGAKTKFRLAIGFFFRKKLEQGHSKISIELKDGSSREFHRYYIKRSRTLGKGDLPTPDEGTMSFIDAPFYFRGEAVQIVTELDGNDSTNFVAMIRAQEFYETRDKEEIETLIKHLNQRFSIEETQPFFRNYILPSEQDINKYRKVYPSTRIFVNGNGLVEKVKNTSIEEIKVIALDSFKTSILKKHLGKNPFRRTRSRFRSHRLVTCFEQLKKAIDSNDKESLIKHVSQFLENTFTEELGVDFLKTFLGTDNIFVMGNISGIYPSFNNMEDGGVPLATRRFAGKSWGTYSVVPPIEKFLLNERLVVPSAFIDSQIPMYDIFGGLPNGLPLVY